MEFAFGEISEDVSNSEDNCPIIIVPGVMGSRLFDNNGFQWWQPEVDKVLNWYSRLDDNFKKSNETFANILERLATIDNAQKKIDNLSTDIISLQSVLTDKKSRGIFGEVSLKHILYNIFGDNSKLYSIQQKLSNGYIVDCMLYAPLPLGSIAIDSKFPLENYQNMVDKTISSEDRKKYENENTKLELCDNLQKIIDKYKNSEEEIFIIGGGEIYKKAFEMKIVKRIYMSHVNFSDKNADTYFPKINLKKWVVITKENYDGWRFCIYEKISG